MTGQKWILSLAGIQNIVVFPTSTRVSNVSVSKKESIIFSEQSFFYKKENRDIDEVA